jgi:hypothetical protein
MKHTAQTKEDFFEGNQVRREFRRVSEAVKTQSNKWFVYLNECIAEGKYIERVIKGYECTACGTSKVRKINAASLDSPPLPLGGNGF